MKLMILSLIPLMITVVYLLVLNLSNQKLNNLLIKKRRRHRDSLIDIIERGVLTLRSFLELLLISINKTYKEYIMDYRQMRNMTSLRMQHLLLTIRLLVKRLRRPILLHIITMLYMMIIYQEELKL